MLVNTRSCLVFLRRKNFVGKLHLSRWHVMTAWTENEQLDDTVPGIQMSTSQKQFSLHSVGDPHGSECLPSIYIPYRLFLVSLVSSNLSVNAAILDGEFWIHCTRHVQPRISSLLKYSPEIGFNKTIPT